jgi:hypothetical protein
MTWLLDAQNLDRPLCDHCGAEGPCAPLGPDPECMAPAMQAAIAAGWTFPIVGRAQVDTCPGCSNDAALLAGDPAACMHVLVEDPQ